ncbi:MAG: GGDEF domain-containing protein [Clostridiales bacterium]|nr:GGDEF domain-containing protein [Clostridiales bacterium]
MSNKLIALCTSRVYDPQIHGFINRFNELVKAAGFSVLIFTINSDIYWEEDRQATEKYVFDLIPYKDIDAIVIMDEKIKSHKIANKIISKASSYDLPVVIADGHYEGCSCINYDYEKGFEQVVRHIIEHHHIKRPHMMAGHRNNEFSDNRIRVFKKVIEENGIPFDDSMISYGDFWADPCRVATRELLDRDEPLPEAIICGNDIMAITVSEMLINEGYKIPEDVLISGFDGYDEIYFTEPKITTASCDILDLANVTAQTLFETLDTGKVTDAVITPSFQANESCGCPEHNEHPSILRNWFKESFSRLNDDNRVLQFITSSMQTSLTPGELASHLESYKTNNTLIAVDRKCFEEDINYFTDDNIPNELKDFVLIYDTDHPENYKDGTLDITTKYENQTEDVLTSSVRQRILELTDSGYPLIFNALDFMNRPIGFVCYFFRDYLISNYTNTMGVTNAISTGIGGYINIRYQRTLLSKMDEMYRHDALTGLYNRIGFQNDLKRLRKLPEYYNKPVTVIMSDLDGLKFINDNYGHAEGDSSIHTVADALFNSVPSPSLSTRFGGDEVFSVVFGECDADAIIKNIDAYLDEYNRTSGKPYKVSTSSGYVISVLDDSFDISHAIKDADEQMYIIKNRKHLDRNFHSTPHEPQQS